MSDIRRRIYNDLSQDYDAGSFEDFTSRIENEESRKKVYNALSEKFDMGSFDEFSKQLGFGNEQKTEPTPTPKPSLDVEQDNVPMEQPVSVAPTVAIPTPKVEDEVSEDNTAVNQPINKTETPVAPKFGTQFKPLKPEIQTIVNPNITTFADQTPQEYAVGVKEGFKQGSKALGAGLQNIAGEALNVATGSSRDDAGALAKMEQMEVVEKQPLLSKAERKMHAMYADDGGNNRIAMVQGEDGKLRRITDEERQKHKDILLQDEYNKIINEAIDEAGGDVVKAKEILSERAADKTAGDKLIEAAGNKMATIKPTKGFGAWAGNIIPQMIPSTLGMGASLLTKNANVGKLIGGLTMGTMSAATAGQSMKEARDAGATSGQVWLTGLTDGLIEWATEQIPYDRYTKRLFNGTKSKINEALGKELAKEASPLKDELGDILKKANKELNGKLLNGKNVKDYISDIAAEGASEFTAEALQTITPIIYANEEDYPTFKQIMEAGWEGAKAGVFMGAILGGTSKSLEYAQNRNRRKQQGYVDVAQVQKDGETVIGEVLGLNKENGRIAMLIDGVSEEFEPANITESYRFTFEEFERGNIEKQQDESFEQGYDLVEPQQMNDAQLELEEAENEAIRAFGVNNIEDVDAALNDMPLSSVLSMVNSVEGQQQILNYLNAKAKVEGMYQKVRDDIDSAVEQSNKLIESRVNKDTQKITPATLKAEDRQVYIVAGDVVMFDDGSAVNTGKSSKDIIVKDANTGKLEMLSSNDVLRVDASLDPKEEATAAANIIREEYATTAANKIDGVVPFAVGDEYAVIFGDGAAPHTAKIVADNGDGSVLVTLDNEQKPTRFVKENLQEMVNAANKARIAQSKQSQVVEQPIAEETQPVAEQTVAEQPQVAEQPIAEEAQEVAPEPVTALSQIPVNENSEPLFEQAPASLTYDALVEMNEGDAAEALDTAQQMLAIAKKELKAEEKSTPKVGGNVMEIQKAKAEKKERMKPLQERVAYWESVVNEPTQRKAKEAETSSLVEEVEAPKAEEVEAPKAEEVAEVAPQEVIEEVKPVVEMTPEESAKIMQKVEKRKGMAKAQSALKEKGRYAKEDAELGDYLDFNDYVMRAIATGSVRFKWSNKPDSATRGLGAHLGASASNEERQSRIWMLSNDFGLYPEEAAEQLLTSYAEYLGYEPNIDTMGALSEIIDIVQSYPKSKMMMEAAQVRHAKDSQQAENDYYENEYVKQAAEENGMTVDEWMAFIDEYVAQYDDIKAIFAEAYLEYEQLNQNNNEQGTGLQGVQQAVSAAEQNTTNDNRGSEVLPTEQSDTNGGVQQGETERRSDEEAVVQGDSSVSDSETQGAAVEEEYKPKTTPRDLVATTKEVRIKPTKAKEHFITAPSLATYRTPIDVFKYVSKEKYGNYTGVYFDKDKRLVATDGKTIIVAKTNDMQRSDAGKFVKNNLEVINEGDFRWRDVIIPANKSIDAVIDFVELADKIGTKKPKKGEKLKAVRFILDGKEAIIPTERLQHLADFQKAVGIGEVRIDPDFFNASKLQINTGANIAQVVGVSREAVEQMADYWDLYDYNIEEATPEAETIPAEEIEDNYRFKSVYHGSGADFDKFDHSFMGTGEGHQAFGWGTYVTDVEGIGKQYARMTSKPQLTFKGEFVNAEGFYNPWRIVTDLYKDNQGKLREMRAKAERYSSLVEEDNPKLKALWEDVKQVLATVRSGDLNMKPARHLYSVEIPDDNGSNYIYWDKVVSDEAIDNLQSKLNDAYGEDVAIRANLKYGQDGEHLYKKLERVIGDKAASEFLNKNGYVGISYPADNGKAKGANNYVIFNEADLDVTDNIRFRSAEAAPTFYSNAEYAVKAVKQEKATPEQWLKMIEKNGGLKAGEDKWLGLSDWLKSSDKKTLSKQEVLDFIKENQIQIEEVEYVENPQGFEELKREYDGWLRDEGYDYAWEQLTDRYGDDAEIAFADFGGELQIENAEAAATLLGDERSINPTRLDYTTEGLENNKEIALVVPTIESWNESDDIHFGDAGDGRAIAWVRFGETTAESKESIAASEAVENYLAEMREKYGTPVGEETDAMSKSEISHLQRLTARELNSKEHGERVLVIDEVQSKRHQEGREKGYNNPRVIEILNRLGTIESYMHSPQGLSGKMYSEREALKTELESLFEADNPAMKSVAEQLEQKRKRLAELHKEKAEREEDEKVEIYKLRAKQAEVRNVRDYDYYEAEVDKIVETADKRGEEIDALTTELNALNNAYSHYYNTELRNARIGVSPAPFEKNWAELAMKRMLRYAAENGFDKIAWTTGEQQAERYSLGAVMQGLTAYKTSPNTYYVIPYNNGAIGEFVKEYDEKELAETFGKEIAINIITNAENATEENPYEMTGDDLRIGASGMKAFYDQMIPSFMNKYGKKWGVKVQDVTLPHLAKSSSVMHSIDVTDAMRESVMQGQPMFRITNFDSQFNNLQSEYDALDKNDEQALNEWREKKREILQAYLEKETELLALPATPVAFNIHNEQSMRNAYEMYKKGTLAMQKTDVKPYEKFVKALDNKFGGVYIADSGVAFFNVSSKADAEHDKKTNSAWGWYGVLIHENTHRVVEKLGITNWAKEKVWEVAQSNYPKLVDDINEGYKNESESEKGEEILAYALEQTTRKSRGFLLQDYIMGESEIDEVLSSFKKNVPLVKHYVKQILKEYRNGYEERGRSRGEGNSNSERQEYNARYEGENIQNSRRGDVTNAATSLAESLGVKLNVVEDVNDITDANSTMQRAKRGAKAWYDVATDQVYFVAPNATSVQDAEESVLHEVVAHKGLRDVVGRERFKAFLEKVYRGADVDTRRKITQLAAKNGWNFRVATEEYMADIAEEGFDARENRSFWEKVRDLFMDMLREAKIALGYNINDNDLRYMLWRTYQMQKSKGVMAAAEDVVMQQKLGVGNFRTRPVGKSMTEEDRIVAEAKANGTYLKAPNGKDTNLTPKQWAQVRTKAFKEWFGDWENDPTNASKVIDENGEPMVMYHETDWDITDAEKAVFDKKKSQYNGLFFFSNKPSRVGKEYGKNRIDVFLNVRNPKISNTFIYEADVDYNQKTNDGGINKFSHRMSLQNEFEEFEGYVAAVKNPTQIKSATDNVGSFDATNPDVRFRSIGKQNAQPAEEMTKEDLQDAIDKLQKNVNKLRQTIKNAKEFRKALANLVAARVMAEVTDDIINVMGKSEFNGLIRQIREANARQDAEKPLERIEEIIADLKMKGSKQSIDRSLALKVQGETKSGVSIAKSVDDTTRQIITFLKNNISKPVDKLNGMLEGKYEEFPKVIIKDIAEHYRNADDAMYDVEAINQEIKELKEENTRIRLQRADLNKQGNVKAADELATILKHNLESISALETERLNTKEQAEKEYEYVNNALSSLLLQGQGAYKTLMFENMRNKVELIDMAIEDVDTGQTLSVLTKKPAKFEKAKKLIGNLLFTPANSLNYLLKRITVNAPNGEGNMYDYFIRSNNGYIAAAEKAYDGYNEFKEELNNKAKDVFGKSYKDAIADSDKLSNIVITVKADMRQQEVPLTYGQAMYLYMVNKMADGKVKLNKMGIFDEQIELLKQNLPAEYIAFADWLQKDFLPKKREKYNDTHLRIFGTQMAAIENYVPMKVKKDETYQEVDGSKQDTNRLPTSITGSIINRKRNNVILDLTTNALDLMLSHGQEMEHWNAYSPVVRDMNALLSNTTFRNILDNRKDGLHKDLMDASKVASEQFVADVDKFSEAALIISKGVTASKIAFRLWTAMKQVLSFPAFIAYSASVQFQMLLGKSLANPYGAWKWGMENLPLLNKRWASRTMGNEKLAQISESTFSKIIDGTAQFGMMPNALVDAVTCAVGAKAVYDYKLGEYQKLGIDDVEADRRAKIDATLVFNESQQSGEGLFLSKIQANKDIASVAISTFNNSNFGYLRKMLEGLTEMTRNKKAEESYLYKKYLSQGLEESTAERLAKNDVARAKRTAYLTVAMYGFILNIIWTAGSNTFKYAFSDDDDDELKGDLKQALVMAPIRNTAIGSMAESAAQGFDVNPLTLMSDINRTLDILRQDEAKRWDYSIGYVALKLAAAIGTGVDLETAVRLYEGVEGIISDRSLDIEDAMALVSAPRSQALIEARKPKQGESVAEYQERISKIERRFDDRVTDNLRKTWISNYYMYNIADRFGLATERDDFGRVSIPEYNALKEEAKATKARESDYKKRGIPKSDMKEFEKTPEYKRMKYNKAVTSALTSLRADLSAEDRAAKEAELYKNMESLLSEGEE